MPISRQRLVELAIVVFGVLIALGLENLVEEIRLRGDARDLEMAFQGDILDAIQYSWERQAVDKCLTERLSSLTERALSRGGTWEAAPGAPNGSVSLALPAPYRSPIRQWTTASFDRALGTEAFKRIPRERANAYAVLFSSIAWRREGNGEEFQALARLAPLAFPMSGVDNEVRADMLQALSQLDRDRALALAQADQFVAFALTIPGSDAIADELLDQREIYEEAARSLVATYGDCVDRGATDRLMRLASK
jgi:hypothetical protein